MHEISGWLQSAYWIVLTPFLSGLFIILFNSFVGDRWGKLPSKVLCMSVSVGTVLYGFIHSLLIFGALTQNPTPYQMNFDWWASESFKLQWGCLVDNLSCWMMLVVTVVSLLVQVYTHGYMREDPGYRRFYSYLSLFTGSMLGLVVSTNIFQMFVFWELVGVCSYLLIGFWWTKPSAANACLKAFVVNRVGDFGFLVGALFLFLATFGFWRLHAETGILAFYDPAGQVDLQHAIQWALTTPGASFLTPAALTVISVLIFLGPMAKSAQAPLHVWLPDAMEGPTPISALIHAATMVAAGIYMVARAYPIWLNWADPLRPTTLGSDGLGVIAWVGGLTAFMAATIAMSQFDIKRALAWSTVSQLGYMFVGLGTGGFSAGLFHLTTHAFFKAMLFLCSGSVIHALHGEQDMRNMGGLWSKTRYTSMCFLIGTCAISGIPGLAGFFSKDEIIGSALNWTGPGGPFLGYLMIFTAGLTAFYMFRMFFMTFTGEYRGKAHVHEEHNVDPITGPLCVLALPSIFAGAIGAGAPFFKSFIALTSGQDVPYTGPFAQFVHFGAHAHPEHIHALGMGASVLIGFAGLALAFLAYNGKGYSLDVAAEKALGPIYRFIYRFSLNKWYWDELYMFIVKRSLAAFEWCWTFIDKFLIDRVMVDGTRWLFTGLGALLKFTENGRGQAYALAIFASVAIIGLLVYFTMVP
ncbi:MAG: NADH-quinone oxidoreductase subunit L [Candidatus Obscuribacterales bacterium]|nr:NADH-quinone oxidoreductase subunit L [Candidatus Obscuribacterales bacterium]